MNNKQIAEQLFQAGQILNRMAEFWADDEQAIFEKFQEDTNGSYAGGSFDDLAHDFMAMSKYFRSAE